MLLVVPPLLLLLVTLRFNFEYKYDLKISIWSEPIRSGLSSTSSGLVPMVNFATRGPSILDNCLTNHAELFNDPVRFQALIKTDHWGVVLPLGNKTEPIRSKCCFRDFREHHKIKFTAELEDFDWTPVISLVDKYFPVRRVVMSSRGPPWITPLVKYLLRKRKELLIRATFTKRRTCHRRSTSWLVKIEKTGARMEHRGFCTGGGEWIKSP